MRSYRIDFNLTDPFPDGRLIGRIGEKNAAQLIITPPAEMEENENITNYVAVFSTVRGTVETDPYIKGEEIAVAVTERLSVGHAMAVQLEGHDDGGNVIVKTPLIYGLTFDASAVRCGCNIAGGYAPNTALPSHYHKNKAVLDKLAESDGSLTYDGKTVGAQNIKTVELYYDNGDVDAIVDSYLANTFLILDYNSVVPQNSEILSVEIKIFENGAESEWVDLRNMIAFDLHAPYIIHGKKAFYLNDLGGTCIALGSFLLATNKFYDCFAAGLFVGARVTYVDESGAE